MAPMMIAQGGSGRPMWAARRGRNRRLAVTAEEGKGGVVGVLGGGQLGRMLALAAAPMGVRVVCLDPSPPGEAPAAVAAEHISGSFRDRESVLKLAGMVDVLTVEVEHVDAQALAEAAKVHGVEVHPAPTTLALLQDKLVQKEAMVDAGVAVSPFMALADEEGSRGEDAGRIFGFPLVLKSRRLAYDGRGNYTVRGESDIEIGISKLGGYEQGLYAEKWVPFERELAVMVARGRDGEVKAYPVVETVHTNHICDTVTAPAKVDEATLVAAEKLARQAIGCLEGAGVFGVEMFVTGSGEVSLNEIAPRPHNSGHYTIEACHCSQYEQQVRAVLGWPLGDTSFRRVTCAVMKNILGAADGEEGKNIAEKEYNAALSEPRASVHWYGKEPRSQRKIGHYTVVGGSRSAVANAMKHIENVVSGELGSDAGGEKKVSPQIGIIMGSDSDLPTMRAAAEILADFGIEFELTIVSAHRTPERLVEYSQSAAERGLKAIIAGAGGAAHLPGMVASLTPLPVIGVPVKPAGCSFDGMDALLSIVQMPKGVPVATVAVGNAANAGLLAARIIGSAEPSTQDKMKEYQLEMKNTVLEKASKLESQGWEKYAKE